MRKMAAQISHLHQCTSPKNHPELKPQLPSRGRPHTPSKFRCGLEWNFPLLRLNDVIPASKNQLK